MDTAAILHSVDHTLLSPDATWSQVQKIISEGIEYQTASVCIPPAFVARAAEFAGGKIPICTVIGFPNGYSTTAAKVFETKDAVSSGADEIDMVIQIGALKEGRYDIVKGDIEAVREACSGKILKVIVETCLLTAEEKIRMCEIVTESGADFIKTSTGFSKAGATREDIRLFAQHVGKGVRVKAAGGIRTLGDAADFLELGAERLGTSRIVALVRSSGPDGGKHAE